MPDEVEKYVELIEKMPEANTNSVNKDLIVKTIAEHDRKVFGW